MNDPRRIPRILEKLRIIWTVWDSMRLGQLVENLSGERPRIKQGGLGFDWEVFPPSLWDIKDKKWEKLLDKKILEFENGVKLGRDGQVFYLDKDRLVTREHLYED